MSGMNTEAGHPAIAPAPGSVPPSTTDLLREALGEVQEVVRLEVALARREVTTELSVAKTAAMALGAAAVTAILGVAMFLVAIALALPVPWVGWVGAMVMGSVLLLLAAWLGAVGWGRLPNKPLEKTTRRVETDIAEAKERLA